MATRALEAMRAWRDEHAIAAPAALAGA